MGLIMLATVAERVCVTLNIKADRFFVFFKQLSAHGPICTQEHLE